MSLKKYVAVLQEIRATLDEADGIENQMEEDALPELDELLDEMDQDDLDMLDSLDEDELYEFFIDSELIVEAGCGAGERMVFGRCAKVSKGGIKRKVAGAAKAAAAKAAGRSKWKPADAPAQKGKGQTMRNPEQRKKRIAAVKDAIKKWGHRGAMVSPKEQAALDRDKKRQPGGRTRGGQETPLPDKKAREARLRRTQAKARASRGMAQLTKELGARKAKKLVKKYKRR